MSVSYGVTLPILFVTVALLFWSRIGRYSGFKPAVAAMCWALVYLDLALLFSTFNPWIGALTGIASFPQYLMHASVLTAAFFLAQFVVRLNRPEPDAQRIVTIRRFALYAALAALTVFFVLGPAAVDVPVIASEYGTDAFVLAYLVVYVAYLGTTMLDVALLARFARLISRPWLRLGLRSLGLGASIGVVYVLHRIGAAIATAAGIGWPWTEADVSEVIVIIAIAFMMFGVLVPPVGIRWDAYRARQVVHPLWRDLTDQVPELVFKRRKRDVRSLLTEIRDICIGPLQPHLDPEVTSEAEAAATAEGLSTADARAVGQAACIAAALASLRAGSPSVTGAVQTIGVPPDDTTTEVEELIRVASAYQESPIVARFKENDHAH